MKRLIVFTILFSLFFTIAADNQVLPDRSLDMANEMIYVGFKAASESSNIAELDNLYSHLANNLNLENADEKTGEQITNLLNNIESLRMLDIKRDRLEKIYDLRKSQLVSAAVPNPINLVGTIGMFAVNPVQGLTSLLGTAASSALMYKSASSALNLEMLNQKWELEDGERATLHTNTTELVEYARELVNQYEINVHKVMTEELISRFVELTSVENKSEIQRSIGQLEFNQSKYESFSRYWLELADLYYRNGQYDKCLNAIHYYEENFNYTEIYRYNYRYAQILIDGIGSLFILFPDEIELYLDQILAWLNIIKENTQLDDWLQNYYCASIYLILSNYYSEGIDEAYTLIKYNLDRLVDAQEQDIWEYLKDVPTEADPSYAEEDVPEINDYYKELEEIRNKELPPFNSAYQANLKMLYSILCIKPELASLPEIEYLFDDIHIPQLKSVFLNTPLSLNRADFSLEKDFSSPNFTLSLPAVLVNDQTKFDVKVINLEDSINKEMLSNIEFAAVPIDSALSLEDSGIVEVKLVDRHESTDINDFTAEIHFDMIDDNISKTYNNYGLAILINTEDCPIVLFFAGPSKSEMILVTAEKSLTQPSYYNGFGS